MFLHSQSYFTATDAVTVRRGIEDKYFMLLMNKFYFKYQVMGKESSSGSSSSVSLDSTAAGAGVGTMARTTNEGKYYFIFCWRKIVK